MHALANSRGLGSLTRIRHAMPTVARPPVWARHAPHRLPLPAKKDTEEADWDEEMSIFKARISRPNQLATLRELEAKVAVGKVNAGGDKGGAPRYGSSALIAHWLAHWLAHALRCCLVQVMWADDSLAILTGVNPDAPLGTKLSFVSGGTG